MTLPSQPRTYDSILNDVISRVRVLEAMPGLNAGEWVAAVLEAGWSSAGGSYYDPAYRIGFGGDTLELRGNIIPDSIASSGTTAFVLDAGYAPAENVTFLTDIVYGSGFTAARVLIVPISGDVIIEFPCVCP